MDLSAWGRVHSTSWWPQTGRAIPTPFRILAPSDMDSDSLLFWAPDITRMPLPEPTSVRWEVCRSRSQTTWVPTSAVLITSCVALDCVCVWGGGRRTSGGLWSATLNKCPSAEPGLEARDLAPTTGSLSRAWGLLGLHHLGCQEVVKKRISQEWGAWGWWRTKQFSTHSTSTWDRQAAASMRAWQLLVHHHRPPGLSHSASHLTTPKRQLSAYSHSCRKEQKWEPNKDGQTVIIFTHHFNIWKTGDKRPSEHFPIRAAAGGAGRRCWGLRVWTEPSSLGPSGCRMHSGAGRTPWRPGTHDAREARGQLDPERLRTRTLLLERSTVTKPPGRWWVVKPTGIWAHRWGGKEAPCSSGL